MLIEDEVYYCGFNSIKSAGANAYFIARPGGNWLVSTPKFVPHLVNKFEKLGGVKHIFISHRDDLGETEKYQERFRSNTIIHRKDLDCYPQAGTVLEGQEQIDFEPAFKIIPTPGHTEGHCMLLYHDKFLFTADSLRFNRETLQVELWNPYWTWFSYQAQVDSVARLHRYRFQWILTSHGQRVKLAEAEMSENLKRAIEKARAEPNPEPCDEQRLRNLEYYIGELRKLNQHVYANKIDQKAEFIRQTAVELNSLQATISTDIEFANKWHFPDAQDWNVVCKFWQSCS